MVWNMLFLPEQLPEIGTSIPSTPRLSPFVMMWSVLYLLRSESLRSGDSFFYFFRILSIVCSFIVRILSSAGIYSSFKALEFEPTLFWLFRRAVLFIPIMPTLLLYSGRLLISILMPELAVFR